MPLQFAPNLSMLYSEVPFLDRFERRGEGWLSSCGFSHFPYDFAKGEIRARLEQFGLQAVLFNINPGDVSRNERGSMGDPDRKRLLPPDL